MLSIYMASVPYKMAGRHPRYRGHCVPSGHSTVNRVLSNVSAHLAENVIGVCKQSYRIINLLELE